jgi:hypothetical protein
MGVTTSGFDEFSKYLGGVSRKVDTVMDRRVARAANIIRMNVIKVINSQPAGWAALNPKYAAWKAAHGGSRLRLVSGIRNPGSRTPAVNYRNSFDVTKLGNAKYASGTNYPQARALERGNEAKGVQARPHFGPAVDQSKPAILQEYKDGVKEIFAK